jgi:uncharacterized protein YlxW (UPF0749 family)
VWQDARWQADAAAREKQVGSLFATLRASEEQVRKLQAEVRERLPPTQKFTKSQRIKRAQETKEARARLESGTADVAGSSTIAGGRAESS